MVGCGTEGARAALLLLVAAVRAGLSMHTPPRIRRVVVSGGTHGNEYTGIYVLQRLAHL